MAIFQKQRLGTCAIEPWTTNAKQTKTDRQPDDDGLE